MQTCNVLFLCTGNSARSQMAEAFLRRYASDRFDVYSAGTRPTEVNPLTVQVMDEVGIDISGQRSKGVKEYLGRIPVRFLIIVCESAQQTCPTIWPGMRERLVWPFDDPTKPQASEDDQLAHFRRIRDEIDEKIQGWLETMPSLAVACC